MHVDAVDLFYLSMPEVRDVGDGSQDALLVRVRAGDHVGYGECEASPLPSIAAFVAPMSHSACKPVAASVLGQRVDAAEDVRRIVERVRADSLDLLQAEHTLSGIEMALLDLLGRRFDEPVYRLLGYERAYRKQPYASVLFGDTPAETADKGASAVADGFRAVKFGWGPFGRSTLADDEAQVEAARAGIGADAVLLVDAGTVFGEDVEAAAARLPILESCRATWYEEPLVKHAYDGHRRLREQARTVGIAGGEGSHNPGMARAMIDHALVAYVQIDAGRIGGVLSAKEVADYAAASGVTYVNHTFTSQLALSASLQPFAGLETHVLCEYPREPSALCRALTTTAIERDADGLIAVPEAPGYGIDIDPDAVRRYLVDTEIRVGGRVLYRTPEV